MEKFAHKVFKTIFDQIVAVKIKKTYTEVMIGN